MLSSLSAETTKASLTMRDLVSVPDWDAKRCLGLSLSRCSHDCIEMQRGEAALGLPSFSASLPWVLWQDRQKGRTEGRAQVTTQKQSS